MILAKTRSNWLKQYLTDQGGALTVTRQLMVVDWRLAGEVPSGRVGKPDNPDDYLPIQVGEWGRRYGTIYVPWEMWKALKPMSQEFVFYIQDYGRFSLTFDVPIERLQM